MQAYSSLTDKVIDKLNLCMKALRVEEGADEEISWLLYGPNVECLCVSSFAILSRHLSAVSILRVVPRMMSGTSSSCTLSGHLLGGRKKTAQLLLLAGGAVGVLRVHPSRRRVSL
uniref:Kinesin motor domain-containing protein n=1 Tax=Heterorhabditis bacteriophora TaxID=37862 RepID=A0A1I7W7H9_HETBA